MRIRKLFVYNYSFEREHVSTNWIKQKKSRLKKLYKNTLGIKVNTEFYRKTFSRNERFDPLNEIKENKRKEEYLLTEYPRPAVSIA